MAADPIEPDPDLEGLLRELADEQGGRLLRVPARAALQELVAPSTAVSAGAPSLLPAERELLRCHREQLAWLLRDACVTLLSTGPLASLHLVRHITRDRELEVRAKPEWDRDARASVSHAEIFEGNADVATATRLLAACTAAPSFDAVSVPQLAAAAQRIVPRDEAQLYAALASSFAGDHGAALRLTGKVLQGGPSPIVQTYAWLDIAFARDQRGELDLAREANRTALRGSSDNVMALMNGLVAELRAGAAVEAVAAARLVDDHLPPNHPAVLTRAAALRRQRRSGDLSLDSQSVRICLRILDGAGRTTKDLIDAML